MTVLGNRNKTSGRDAARIAAAEQEPCIPEAGYLIGSQTFDRFAALLPVLLNGTAGLPIKFKNIKVRRKKLIKPALLTSETREFD